MENQEKYNNLSKLVEKLKKSQDPKENMNIFCGWAKN